MPAPDSRPAAARITGRRLVQWYAAIAAGVLLVLAIAYVLFLVQTSPGVDDLRQAEAIQPTVLLSHDGKPIASYQREKQQPVPLERISKHVIDALIATEDQRFWRHHGIDWRRTIGAAWYTLRGDTQGGSTITQQLARNLCPDDIGRERTLHRKLKEIVTAVRIERTYGKRDILENYLNTAPFLYNVVGIEMAARTYFDTSAAKLDVLQSATLIGMLKGTHYYNPVIHPDRARKRRNVVLAQMVKQQLLTEAEHQALRSRPLAVRLNRNASARGDAPHFAAHARKWLIEWADEHDYNLYADGLQVQTTIDSRLQAAAAEALGRQAAALQVVADVEWSASRPPVVSASTEAYAKARSRVDPFGWFWSSRRDLVADFIRESPDFKKAVEETGSESAAFRKLAGDAEWMARLRADKTRLEAGFVAVDPASGEVRAWVGSRDFDREEYDHVAQAARQPGSTFKPIVYGAALERGFGIDRPYVDAPIEVRMGDGSVWRPTDVDASSGRTMTLREGLVYSKNTITAQVMQDVGIAPVVDLARAMGVDRSKLDPVLSLALGTSPVTLLEMASAYATIAAEGTYRKPSWVRRISDRHGRVLAEFAPEPPERALSQQSAFDLTDMMRGVVDRGTGTQARSRFGITADVAGKTGTTQNNTDGWFILMHPQLVAGAWVGFNDPRVTMRSDQWGTGGRNAVLLVGDFFRTALQGGLVDPKAKFAAPRRPPPEPPAPAWINEGSSAHERDADSDSGLPESQGREALDRPWQRTRLAPPVRRQEAQPAPEPAMRLE